MKVDLKLINRYSIWLVLLIAMACSKDETSEPIDPEGQLEETQSNVDTDEYERDEGQLGLGISVRSLKQKGYAPTKAIISILEGDKAGDYEVEIDQNTFLATFSFENKDLSESEKNGLEDGVALKITVENELGEVLAVYTSTRYSLMSSPEEIEVDDSTKADINPIVLNPEVDYYLQILNADLTAVFGAPSATLRTSTTNFATEVKVRSSEDLDYVNDTQETIPFTRFRFETVDAENNIFNIYNPNGAKKHYLYMDGNNRLNVQSEANYSNNNGNTPDAASRANYQFKIEKVDTGKFVIAPETTNIPLIASASLASITSQVVENPSHFRILNFEIDWSIQSRKTSFLAPILPPSQTIAAYNTALKNCGSGPLTDVVGVTESLTRTDTYSWSESIQVATSVEASLSTTISSTIETSVNTQFFGASNSVTASVTAGLSVGHTTTETRTETNETTTSESIKLASERTITVPPGRGTTAADIYQKYENIRIPYVQKYEIRGNYQDGSKLSGLEIMSQFNFNGFSGVVNEVGIDFIDITLRGTSVISHLVSREIVTRDIPDACQN
ncbi:hypothetical protein [Croceivirga thetidis]|uniref:Major fimbrial subunit protein N-terminal domain-containing protein n=1 Tax=Croceivirga thetidis TaxID=2721623 RepID=A0ABX1GSC0_9FLAO|nr:hypothetical protein [Croceivirga thetidis]NKI32494.1 hypothetical protein [Croceivirga thetidis]